jgi:hypothetical protein
MFRKLNGIERDVPEFLRQLIILSATFPRLHSSTKMPYNAISFRSSVGFLHTHILQASSHRTFIRPAVATFKGGE